MSEDWEAVFTPDLGSAAESLDKLAIRPGSDDSNAESVDPLADREQRLRQSYIATIDFLLGRLDTYGTGFANLKKQLTAERTTGDPTRAPSLKGYAILDGIWCSITSYREARPTIGNNLVHLQNMSRHSLPVERTNERLEQLLRLHEHLAGQVPTEYVHKYEKPSFEEGRIRVDVGSLIADGKWDESWLNGFESHLLESVNSSKAPDNDEDCTP